MGVGAVYAQPATDDEGPRLDSLIALLHGEISNSERLEILDEIGFAHYNVDSTAKYANMELKLARELNDRAKIGNAYRLLGWCCYMHDDYERSCEFYTEAINCFDSLGLQEELASVCYGLASTFNVLGDDIMADEYYNRALSYYVEVRNSARVAEIWRKKGGVSSNFHLYMTADDYFRRAMHLDSLNNDSAAIGEDIYLIGANEFTKYSDYADMQALTLARDMMVQAYGIETRHGDWMRMYNVTQKLADVYMALAKNAEGVERTKAIDSSRFYLNYMKSVIENTSMVEEAVYIDFWEADYLILNNRAAEALPILNRIELMPTLVWEKEMRMCDLMIACYEQS
jgi:tetratricopeptide (TPR) repeat protein